MSTLFPRYNGPQVNRFNEKFPLEEVILNKILNGNTFLFEFSSDKQSVKLEFIDKSYFTLKTDDFYKLLFIVIKLLGLNPAKAKKIDYPDFPNDGY